MTECSIMPEEGQFVAIWIFQEKVWSCTLKWESSKLYFYDADTDHFRHFFPLIPRPWEKPEYNPKFFTTGEGK